MAQYNNAVFYTPQICENNSSWKRIGSREANINHPALGGGRGTFIVLDASSGFRFFSAWTGMDGDSQNPCGFHRFHLGGALNKDIVESNKKRKLQTEQFDLPIPKHKRWDHQLPAEHPKTLEESQEVEGLFIHVRKAYTERQAFDNGSDHELGKDSNIFIGDSDSAQSVSIEAYEAEASEIWLSDWPSTSSHDRAFNNFRGTQCSSDNATAVGGAGEEELTSMGGKGQAHHSPIRVHVSEEPEGPIPEFGVHLDSKFKYEIIEQYTDKQLDDILYSNDMNPNVYDYSSGRWAINQDIQTGARKPTIDQEFEQYFSMLML